jgi:hypothetical protein
MSLEENFLVKKLYKSNEKNIFFGNKEIAKKKIFSPIKSRANNPQS